jgi:nucleoside transporter
MMFLQFFIWGSWGVTLGTYLTEIGFTGADVGNIYSTTGWAAIVSPLFVGMVADRFFSAQHVMAILHLLGAGILYYVAGVEDPGTFFFVLLAYSLCYMPTLALVNAISFDQMKDPGTEFPLIRVLGTIGWIVAGLVIGLLSQVLGYNIEETALPLKLAAGSSLALGIFCFFLPNTPPKSKGQEVSFAKLFGLDALSLMKDRSFLVFTLGSLLVCAPLAFYYTFANPFFNELGMTAAASKQTMGQVSEILFMLVMPFFFRHLGVKKMLLIGMLAWVARYVLFAFGDVGFPIELMLWGGILLHGICYDFFFVTGQIYVDKEAPREIRASAQGFIALVTYGVGMVIGNMVAGRLVAEYTAADGTHDWQTIWLIPAGMALVVAIGFFLLFKDPPRKGAEGEPVEA